MLPGAAVVEELAATGMAVLLAMPGVDESVDTAAAVTPLPDGGVDFDVDAGVVLRADVAELLQPNNNSAGMTIRTVLNRIGTAAGIITTSPS